MKYDFLTNFIDGEFKNSSSQKFLEVISPVDGSLLSKVVLSSSPDLDNAVNAAKKAFPAWSKTPIKERVQVFFVTEIYWKKICKACRIMFRRKWKNIK